jgi:protein-L-isoaspartate(D-aspartate) O-methyltransferase
MSANPPPKTPPRPAPFSACQAVLVLSLLAGFPSLASAQPRPALQALRAEMVELEIIGAGVKNERVIAAMRATPRHEFVPNAQRKFAYLDMALPIGDSQTISPPFIVAYMTEQLDPQPNDKVLEIGTGSGYQAAVLSPLAREVYTIEIVKNLGEKAARTLARLKYTNVHTRVGDGYQGWPEAAPFDRIIVTCSPEDVPQTLVDQLRDGGRMVIPLGERYQQTLYLFTKHEGRLQQEALRPTLFVPMTGAAEARRKVLPDPKRPEIQNGDFEDLVGRAGQDQAADPLAETVEPAAWHYQRQLKLVAADDAPRGKRYARFTNREPGRGSQALQGFAVDGRAVAELEVSLWVKAFGVQVGPTPDQLPMLAVTFYDERRATVGHEALGPWRGTFPWQQDRAMLTVPIKAREAVLRIGLLGATGELSLDAIELRSVPARGDSR